MGTGHGKGEGALEGLTHAVLLAGSGLAVDPAEVRQPGLARTEVLHHQRDASRELVTQVRVDFDPGAASARHTHPGEEIAYVLRGTLRYELEGWPPLTLEAGQAVFIPPGTMHVVRNVGDARASALATYLVRKGRPLVMMSADLRRAPRKRQRVTSPPGKQAPSR